MSNLSYDGPIVLAILDGVGLAPDSAGNAVSQAHTPFLGYAAQHYLHVALNASGEAVGLTPGQMGNSEVGHNTMGAGQIIKYGIARVNDSIESGEIFTSEAWRGAIRQVLGKNPLDKSDEKSYNKEIDQRTLHFAGIFSDGGVHSHIDHLKAMIRQAYQDGVRRMRVHAVFDGRDVAPQSEPRYIRDFEAFASKFPGADIRIASGGGRMVAVADRYESDWEVVARGWDMMVHGHADYYFKTPEEAITVFRRIYPNLQDQNLPPFVIVEGDDQPIGKIEKGDALIYFDFRADRAVEIAMAFTYWDFPYFNRGDYRPSDIYFAGLAEYNSDTHVPEHQLLAPIRINDTLNQFLGARDIPQFAVSETVKFGHVTYYFNGNSYEKARGESFQEIASYTEPFETRPWMRCAEITDAAIKAMPTHRFVRLNFPGGDMVGHTADLHATIVALESIDLSLKRLAAEVDRLGGAMIIVADHGNAEAMLDKNGQPKTSHTVNRVPCIIYDNTKNRERYRLAPLAEPGLSNLAATIAVLLLGKNHYPKSWRRPLIELK